MVAIVCASNVAEPQHDTAAEWVTGHGLQVIGQDETKTPRGSNENLLRTQRTLRIVRKPAPPHHVQRAKHAHVGNPIGMMTLFNTFRGSD